MLDAERDAFFFLINIQNDGLDGIALLIFLDDLLARTVPVEIGQMHHAVHIAFKADEQTEFGLVLDLALNNAARRELLCEGFPWVLQGLLQAQRNAALGLVNFQNLDINFLAGGDNLARMHVFLGPGHFRNMDEAFNARLQLNKCTVVGDIGDAAMERGVERIFRFNRLPRIILQLLHAQRDTMGVVVDLDDAHLDRLANIEHFGRVVDAAPCNVGDMQQAVNAAQVHESTVIGDVLDGTVDDLAFFKVGHDHMTLLGAALFENSAARHNNVATAAVHLENDEGLGNIHQRGNIADRANVHLAARQEGHSAIEINSEATLDLIENNAVHFFLSFKGFFKLDPAFFTAGLVTRDDRFTERIFNTLKVNLHDIADVDGLITVRAGKFFQGHAAFGLQADVDHGHIFFDADHGALNNGPFESFGIAIGFLQECSKIVARWRELISISGHKFS